MSPSPAGLRAADFFSPTVAALISVLVNYGGTFVLVFQAAELAGLTPGQTASWVWAVSVGVGVTGAWRRSGSGRRGCPRRQGSRSPRGCG